MQNGKVEAKYPRVSGTEIMTTRHKRGSNQQRTAVTNDGSRDVCKLPGYVPAALQLLLRDRQAVWAGALLRQHGGVVDEDQDGSRGSPP